MAQSPDSPSPGSEHGSLLDDVDRDEDEFAKRDRAVVGCILGTAIGDALGLPYEGLSPHRAERLLGPPERHRFLFGRGMISDDTEHTCIVAESLLVSKSDSEFTKELVQRLRNWLRYVPAGIGLATLRACLKLNRGVSPTRSGIYSAGNGPAMRAAIIGAAVNDLVQLQRRIEISTRITHTDPRAEYGALVVALAAHSAASNQNATPSDFIALLKQLHLQNLPNGMIELLEQAAASVERGESTQEFARSIGLERGVTGFVNHTVPVAMHASWMHPTDFRSAVQSVICCGGDADSTAAIVGGIIGARVGKAGLPIEWLHGVRDWPRSVAWMEQLGHGLARIDSGEPGESVTQLSRPGLLARNLFFAAVVLFHGLRRLFPPY